jgi:uncharacterized protein
MHRIFLDANVLFSAAYRADSGLLRLWTLPEAQLCSSRYALEEARINLEEETQRHRLVELAQELEFFDSEPEELPRGIHLPQKDVPILLAAIAADATHLLTGDVRHFGQFFGKKIVGVLIQLPGDYLKKFAR